MKIDKLVAYEILDSRSNPTVEVHVVLEDGTRAKAAVPSGASTGTKEAIELRDGDKDRFYGKGVLKACENVEKEIFPAIKDLDVFNQVELDKKMISLDGTDNKSRLGANSILGVSLAVCRAAAKSKGVSLWRHIQDVYCFERNGYYYDFPVPMLNIINGGAHSDSGLDIQEFMVVPSGIKGFFERIKAGSEIYNALKKRLIKKGYRIAIGDEGGFAPHLNSNEEALENIAETIKESSYKFGEEVKTGLDVAASEFYNKDENTYELSLDKKRLNSDELAGVYGDWIDKYKLELIEDPMSEFDWKGWSDFTTKNKDKISVIGDDLIVTNKDIVEKAGKEGACNAALIKVNQIGSLTETIECIQKAREFEMKIAISHRSGETTDDFIADLAVAVEAEYVKFGALARGERVCKYNRIMEIEREVKLRSV